MCNMPCMSRALRLTSARACLNLNMHTECTDAFMCLYGTQKQGVSIRQCTRLHIMPPCYERTWCVHAFLLVWHAGAGRAPWGCALVCLHASTITNTLRACARAAQVPGVHLQCIHMLRWLLVLPAEETGGCVSPDATSGLLSAPIQAPQPMHWWVVKPLQPPACGLHGRRYTPLHCG